MKNSTILLIALSVLFSGAINAQHNDDTASSEVVTEKTGASQSEEISITLARDYSDFLPSGQNYSSNTKVLTADYTDYFKKLLQDGKIEAERARRLDMDHKKFAEYYLESNEVWSRIKDSKLGAYQRWKDYCEADPLFCTRAQFRKAKEILGKLSRVDLANIVNYTEWSYLPLNQFLWDPEGYHSEFHNPEHPYYSEKESKEELFDLEANLMGTTTALNKLDPVPEGTLVYRCDIGTNGSRDPPKYVTDFFQKETEGEVSLFKGFKSTTLGIGERARQRWVDECPYLRIIETAKNGAGRDITHLSTRTFEEEVLFLPNTYFKATEYKEVVRTRTEFDLDTGKEVEVKFLQKVMVMKECPSASACM